MYLRVIFGICICASVAQGWFWPWGNDEPDPEEQARAEERDICLANPQPDDKLGVEFILFTQNSETSEDITAGGNAVLFSNFNPKKDTKFIIHGYTDNGNSYWIRRIVTAILDRYDVNVICVNWQEGADSFYYGQSAANTQRVGEIIGDFIKQLKKEMDVPYSSHHLIGHSLGAHISGFAGARVGGNVSRITGLDPAGPCFRWAKASARLSHHDAIFVDAIHTDGDYLFQGGCGAEKRMGDADFYPNGGEKQPGCDWWWGQHAKSFLTGWIKGFKESISCSHTRATELFYYSIENGNQFKAFPCNHHDSYESCQGKCGATGCSRMGYHADPSLHGVFTLITGEKPPFTCEKEPYLQC